MSGMSGDHPAGLVRESEYQLIHPAEFGRLVALYLVMGVCYVLLSIAVVLLLGFGGLIFLAEGDSTAWMLILAAFFLALGGFVMFGAMLAARHTLIGNGEVVTRDRMHVPPGYHIDVRRAWRNKRLALYLLLFVTATDVFGTLIGLLAPLFLDGGPTGPSSILTLFFGPLTWVACLPGFFVLFRQHKRVTRFR
ncbi:hypothetical protein SAMN04487819_12016 [Actinopolyspora alba]|uniref:Uncharacterized protein n=1 Tax=Actinopolyspora alba TaxID=673379 RepID=A0A1I2C9D5_9ACTN|nr:hypothetical protein [Actinopolyspora alba]SFE64874.1 hypothetical protein SAMN04487819_12016 [Actinopolyspora alba]